MSGESRLRWWMWAVALILAGVVILSSCGIDKATEQFKDAPRGEIDGSPADILRMPDGFSNVATKCDGPNRVYVVFKSDKAYGALAVAPNDPRCRS